MTKEHTNDFVLLCDWRLTQHGEKFVREWFNNTIKTLNDPAAFEKAKEEFSNQISKKIKNLKPIKMRF